MGLAKEAMVHGCLPSQVGLSKVTSQLLIVQKFSCPSHFLHILNVTSQGMCRICPNHSHLQFRIAVSHDRGGASNWKGYDQYTLICHLYFFYFVKQCTPLSIFLLKIKQNSPSNNFKAFTYCVTTTYRLLL